MCVWRATYHQHAFTCPSGGYPAARHNQIRDLLAGVLREVLPDVECEPVLLPFEGERLTTGRTANTAREARLDIRARDFWSRQQDAFFDVRVTHPKASLLSRAEVMRQLQRNENEKKRAYAVRVNTIDRGSFTPLVFSTNGICGRECSRFLKALAELLLGKNVDLAYSTIMNRLRVRIAFCLVRWCIVCFHGCRASYHRSLPASGFANECRQLAG